MASIENVTTVLPVQSHKPAAPFSYETYAWAEFGIYVVATGSFAIFGTFSNTLNVIVFYRQGIMSNSSTVTLTGLAVSDLFNCLLTIFAGVTFTLMHFFSPYQFMSSASSLSLIATRPMEFTIQTTCWITAFTAFERVVCVLFPFKVRSLFTPTRSLGATVGIFLSSFFLNVPSIFRESLEWQTDPATNYTYLNLKPIESIAPLWTTAYIIARSIVLRFLAIFIVVICNIILFWRVNQSNKFRKTAATGNSMSTNTSTKSTTPTITTKAAISENNSPQETDQGGQRHTNGNRGSSDNTTNANRYSANTNTNTNTNTTTNIQSKEMKLLKMITVISVVFTVCYSFYVVYTIHYLLANHFKAEYHPYVDFIAWDVSGFFQIVNSSTNIIIYYKMSTRFKEDFDELWTKWCGAFQRRQARQR